MITRNEIIKIIKKHKGKTNKKEEVRKELQTKNLGKKKVFIEGHWTEKEELDLILDDLESYQQWH